MSNIKVSLIGNCQIKALTWYIQQLNSDFDVKYIYTNIGMQKFAKKNYFKGKTTPTIINTEVSLNRLLKSDYIIYQPIKPSRIKNFNYKDIQKYSTKSRLISIGCFYCENTKMKNYINNKLYQEKSGLLGMKERAKKFNLDIQPHKIIEKHGICSMSTQNPYHPKVLYFLESVKEICELVGWDYYSSDQYNQYLKERYPFG